MATIHDVARLAKVSIKTVSRVLNGEDTVRPSTRSIVEQAIRELEYTPHVGARSMRSKRSGLVAMITGEISSADWVPYKGGLTAIPIIHGAQQTFRTAGKTLLIAATHGDPDDVAELFRTFHAHRVEGLVFSTGYHREVAFGFDFPFPTVLVNCFDRTGTPAIVPDDELAQRKVVEDMVRAGHRSIGMIGLPAAIVAGRLRRKAFLEVATDAGLPKSAVHFAEGSRIDGERETSVLTSAISEILEASNPPTALCFGNDLMAMRAIQEFDRMGLKIGRDIAVWGYDNDLAICESVLPRLSTVSLPYYEMGVAAADMLMSVIGSGPAPASRTRICGELVVRESSGITRPRLVSS